MIVAWSNNEAGRYLETLKAYENKPPEMLMGIKSQDYLSQLRECMTSIKSVNKTDVVTLLSTFGTLKDTMEATVDELQLCPGFGAQKAERIRTVLRTPFKKAGAAAGTTAFAGTARDLGRVQQQQRQRQQQLVLGGSGSGSGSGGGSGGSSASAGAGAGAGTSGSASGGTPVSLLDALRDDNVCSVKGCNQTLILSQKASGRCHAHA